MQLIGEMKKSGSSRGEREREVDKIGNKQKLNKIHKKKKVIVDEN